MNDIAHIAIACALIAFVVHAALRALYPARIDWEPIEHDEPERLSLEEDARRNPF